MSLVSHIYAINLKESTDRWDQIKQQEHIFGIPFTRIDAVRGSSLDENTRRKVTTDKCFHFCTSSMIGIFLSHKKAWEQMLENNDDFCLVLEDDVSLSDNAPVVVNSAMNELLQNNIAFDLLYVGCLGASHPEQNYNLLTKLLVTAGPLKIDNINTFRGKHVYVPEIPIGLHAYVLSKKGALKLLQLFKLVPQAVDIAIIQASDSLILFATASKVAFQTTGDTTQVQGTFPVILSGLKGRTDQNGQPITRNFTVPLFQLGDVPVTGFILVLGCIATLTPVSWTIPMVTTFTLVFLFEIFKNPDLWYVIISYWFAIMCLLLTKWSLAHSPTQPARLALV